MPAGGDGKVNAQSSWVDEMPLPAYSDKMVPFVYRCPATGLNVQGFFADEVPAKETDTYEPVTCTACTRVHLVNRSTGKTLHEYDE
jgi:hypothetical protein